jgi:hypothetical protein
MKDFGDYSDCVEYVNQSEDYGDCLRGEWYYGDDESLIIYYGSFGNYNSPGASCYTHSEQHETENEYRAALQQWIDQPEYLESEEDCDDDDESEESGE